MNKTMVLAAAVAAMAGSLLGAQAKRASSGDIFGISVDAPLPDYVRPADTNGVATIDCGGGHSCVGRMFCGLTPCRVEMGRPDEKGRSMVRMVVSRDFAVTGTRAEWLFKSASEGLDSFANLKRYGSAVGTQGKGAEWYGVGADGVPFAVVLSTSGIDEKRTEIRCEVMDFAMYAEDRRRAGLPKLAEKDRERRLARIGRIGSARCEKMMREKSYSGMWACKAKCYDRIAFCFDKCGIGRFDMVFDGFMVQNPVSAGWFYWTADDKGGITVHGVPVKAKAFTMKLRYDFRRNVMVPDVNAAPFASKVIPNDDNPNCEMQFVQDFSAMDALKKRPEDMMSLSTRLQAEVIAKMPRRAVASFDDLLALAKGSGHGSGLSIRRGGCPTIMVGGWPEPEVVIDVEIARGGDAEAPKLECVAGKSGPDISGKKELESFFEADELKELVKSYGGRMEVQELPDIGIWTWETRRIAVCSFRKNNVENLDGFLKKILGKWYTFPVEAIVMRPDPKAIAEMEAKIKATGAR